MKRSPIPVTDLDGKEIDFSAHENLREELSKQFEPHFDKYAFRLISENRTLREIIEHAYMQGIAHTIGIVSKVGNDKSK